MARGFVFELDAVLEQRHREERLRQREVSELERARLAAEQRVRELQRRMTAGRSELREILIAGLAGEPGPAPTPGAGVTVRVDGVRLAANASLHAVVLLQRAAIDLAGAHAKLAAARQRLLAATTARKAVAMLRARRYEEWRQAIEKREEAEADDVRLMRAARAGNGVPAGLPGARGGSTVEDVPTF